MNDDKIGIITGSFVSVALYITVSQYIHEIAFWIFTILAFFLITGAIVSIYESTPKETTTQKKDTYYERI